MEVVRGGSGCSVEISLCWRIVSDRGLVVVEGVTEGGGIMIVEGVGTGVVGTGVEGIGVGRVTVWRG